MSAAPWRRAGGLAALLAFTLAGESCSELEARTQIMAIVDADDRVQVAASALRLRVYGRSQSESAWEEVAFDELTEPLPTFPFRMAIVPRSAGKRQFRVVSEAQGPGNYLVRAQAIGSFQAGKTLAVQLYLDDRCNQVSCDEDAQTCRAGVCVSALATLEPYDPDDVRHTSGVDARDGGSDAGDGHAPADGGADAGDDPSGDGGTPSGCIPETSRCEGSTLTLCDADGKASAQSCALGCSSSGKACNACEPGKNACSGDSLTVCGEDGTVTRTERCDDGCHPDGDRCRINDCEPATTACVGGQLVVCSATGQVVSNDVCPYGCNAGASACHACEPDSSRCDGDRLIVCDAQGGVERDETCGLGCADGRCLDIAPSNGLDAIVAELSPRDPIVELTGAATIDTDMGIVENGNGAQLDVPTRTLVQNGRTLRVFRVSELHVENVRVTGKHAVVIVSSGPIVITGFFDVSGDGGENAGNRFDGPGAEPDTAACTGRNSPYTNSGWGGAGGGGGATAGGRGGAGTIAGSSGGAAHGNAELVPLVGGCQGGRPTPSNGNGDLAGYGRAGGAVHLVSRTSISVGGRIDAGGGGGAISGFGAPYSFGGAGGGSGGGILLEAPDVDVSGLLASITANGGGGSAGGGMTSSGTCGGDPGADGRFDFTPAAGGGQCSTEAGPAGNGAAGSIAPSSGGNGSLQGGGGGGAAGRIRVNTLGGFTVRNGAKVSPAASEGTLGTR